MIEIDGSYGEGGGQILRTAISLSTLTKTPIKITKIRANRPNPGIKPQHYISIMSIKELCNAEAKGLEIGSPTLTFKPGEFESGDYTFDIGTAGSITLVYQAIILASIKTKKPVSIRLNGGTDVKWSPPWDYFKHVFLPLLKKMGISIEAELVKRGYYPKGGGETVITVYPSEKIKPLQLDKDQENPDVKGLVHIGSLPEHISTRTKNAAIKTLLRNDIMASVEVKHSDSLSPGTGVTLWNETKDTIIGTDCLGERSITSEELGKTVANNLLKELESESTLDEHAFDQLIPYMALAKENGPSTSRVQNITNHAQTNMWLVQQFFDINFQAKQEEKHMIVTIN